METLVMKAHKISYKQDDSIEAKDRQFETQLKETHNIESKKKATCKV